MSSLRCVTHYSGGVAHYIGGEVTAFPDGWETVGDAGWMDDDGYLYIADRVKDMITTATSHG